MADHNKKHISTFPLLDRKNAHTFLLKHSEDFLGKKADARKFSVNLQIIKNNPDPKTRSFVAIYNIKNGAKQIRLIGVNRPSWRSNYEFRILKHLYKQPRIKIKIPKPYIVDKNQNVFFMEYAAGRPLSELINNGLITKKHFTEVAKLLKELNGLKTDKLDFLDRSPYFEWIERDLKLSRKKLSASDFLYLRRKWLEWKKWWQKENSYGRFKMHFAQGDMNPKNIYINTGKKHSLKLIDFDRSHLAPGLWDITGFISQLETYPELKISDAKREQYQKLASEAWKSVDGSPSTQELRRIEYFRQYFRIAAITNIAVWGNPFESKKYLTRLFKNLI